MGEKEKSFSITEIVHPTNSPILQSVFKLPSNLKDLDWFSTISKIYDEFRHWPYRETLYWIVSYVYFVSQCSETRGRKKGKELAARDRILEQYPDLEPLIPMEISQPPQRGENWLEKIGQAIFSAFVISYIKRCARECYEILYSVGGACENLKGLVGGSGWPGNVSGRQSLTMRSITEELDKLAKSIRSANVSLSHLESIPGRLRNLLSWINTISLSHILIQQVQAGEEIEGLHRETLGIDIDVIRNAFAERNCPVSIPNDNPLVAEIFDAIQEDFKEILKCILEPLTVIYCYLRCRWLNEILKLEMSIPIPDVLQKIIGTFSLDPSDFELAGIKFESLDWESVSRISAVLKGFAKVFEIPDETHCLNGYIGYYVDENFQSSSNWMINYIQTHVLQGEIEPFEFHPAIAGALPKEVFSYDSSKTKMVLVKINEIIDQFINEYYEACPGKHE